MGWGEEWGRREELVTAAAVHRSLFPLPAPAADGYTGPGPAVVKEWLDEREKLGL